MKVTVTYNIYTKGLLRISHKKRHVYSVKCGNTQSFGQTTLQYELSLSNVHNVKYNIFFNITGYLKKVINNTKIKQVACKQKLKCYI